MKLEDLKRLCVAYIGGEEQDWLDKWLEVGPKLIAVAEAAMSVLSEEGVKEHLSAYVMGAALIDRLAALEAD